MPTGKGRQVPFRADARVLGARLKAGEKASYRLGKNRRAYLVPAAAGKVEVNGVVLEARDGAAIEHQEELRVTARLDRAAKVSGLA